jgi:hypothetical protein
MTQNDEAIMAYVDGQMESEARRAFESALARDPELARRVAEQQALRIRLREAFDPTLAEPVPARLLHAVRDGSADVAPTTSRFGSRRTSRLAPATGFALAASLLIGVLIGRTVSAPDADEALIVSDVRGSRASGALADALSHRLAAETDPTGVIELGLSYRALDGEFCRTFVLPKAGTRALGGLACRDDAGWEVRWLESSTVSSASGGSLRQAGSALPEGVRREVEASIDGEVFDAAAEARARELDWRSDR